MTAMGATTEAQKLKTLARLSLSIMQKACGVPEHTPAELLPDRISIELPELDAAIELAIGEHCNSHDTLVKRVAHLEALTDWTHTDDVAVNRFCVAMIEKLAKKRAEGRYGWDDPQECTLEMLARMLVAHVPKGDPVDIANFCMMVWTRGETDEDHAPAVQAIRAAACNSFDALTEANARQTAQVAAMQAVVNAASILEQSWNNENEEDTDTTEAELTLWDAVKSYRTTIKGAA